MKREKFMPRGPVALAPKAWGEEFQVLIAVEDATATAPFALAADGELAVVTICGPLVHHEHPFWDNYDAIRGRVGAAFSSDASGVILKIDSPGGDVAGCFELARDLRAMARASGKSLVSYVDGMAASAAYALACSADRIVVPPTGYVGSIGCIDAMCDQTAADAQVGVRYALVASGARKTDGNPHVPITKDAVAALQLQVDGLAALFFELVEEMRGIPPSKTRGMQAAMFFGEGAVAAKLADEVKTFPEVIASATKGMTTMKLTKAQVAEAIAEGKSLLTKAVAEVGTPQAAKYLDEAKKFIKKAIDDGDEHDMKMAKKLLSMIEGQAADESTPKKKDGGDQKKDDDDDGDAEAKKAKKAEESDGDKKAQAISAGGVDVFELQREVHEMRAREAAREREATLKALFAQRADFDEKVRATLSTMPIEKVREAVETWPRIGARALSPAASASVMGTRGVSQTGEPDDGDDATTSTEAAFIDRMMGIRPQAGSIKRTRNTLELGVMTPEQARAKAAELEKKGGV